VLEVEVYVQGSISQEVVEDMFTRAIAAAVDVPMELVVSLIATEVQKGPGSQRRLSDNMANETSHQDNKTKFYEVAYEIMVPGNVNVNEVMEKADRIAEPGSAESLLFRQVLMSTNGVVGVGKIVSKVPAYTVEEATTAAPSEDDEKRWVSVLIGAIAFILGISCLVTTFILVRRKMAAGEASKSSAHQEFHGIP